MIHYKAPAFLGARRAALVVMIALSAFCLIACEQASQGGGASNIVVIETDLGNIKIELLKEEAPKTGENFRALAESGFYNGVVFHRAVRGFMIQGGDPNGNGTGGKTATGEPLPNEIDRNSPLYQGGYYRRGLVAMANKGGNPTSATSQFFIMHGDYPLPPNYTIFGHVIEGQEVVDQIANAPVNGDRLVTPVVMKRVFAE